MRLALLLGLIGCSPSEEDDSTEELEATAVLSQPTLDTIDLPSAFRQGIETALDVRTTVAWGGHTESLERRIEGCPDVYAGGLEDAMEATGLSWSDRCRTDGGLIWDGFAWWDSDAVATGESGSVEGRTEQGTRRLVADASVGTDEVVEFEFDGEAEDSLYRVEAEGYERWTYASTLTGTVTGIDVFAGDSPTPGGWRADMYSYRSGGDVERLELRGNVLFFDALLQGRFDSVAADLEFVGKLGAGPEDCTAEPRGWMGLRDENAWWYDLVFLPRFDDDIIAENYANDPLSVCDGCGTLFVRGVESGEVCVDFEDLFEKDPELPELEEYILTLHNLP